MSSRIKKLVLYFFLTVSSIFIFLIIASGGFLMTARKTQYAENTILEKDLIRRWKYKGFLFQIFVLKATYQKLNFENKNDSKIR